MAERIVSMHAAYKSGQEVVGGFLSRRTAGDPRTAIVLVHGYRGLDDGQRAVTQRFAQEGFVCLSPDLFHGKTFHTLDECALQKTSLAIPRAVEKIIDSVPYLRKLPWVEKKNVAVLGFCMGVGPRPTRWRSRALCGRSYLLPEFVSGSGGSEKHKRAALVSLRDR